MTAPSKLKLLQDANQRITLATELSATERWLLSRMLDRANWPELDGIRVGTTRLAREVYPPGGSDKQGRPNSRSQITKMLHDLGLGGGCAHVEGTSDRCECEPGVHPPGHRHLGVVVQTHPSVRPSQDRKGEPATYRVVLPQLEGQYALDETAARRVVPAYERVVATSYEDVVARRAS